MKTKIIGAICAVLALVAFMAVDTNDTGERRFVQTAWGTTKVVFDEGPFFNGWGQVRPYNDFLTLNFQPEDGLCEYERGDGIKVQYQDGGYGVICGQVRFPLPTDESQMKEIQRKYKGEAGIRSKLIDKFSRKVATTTASLVTSTEAYTTKRAEINRMWEEQFENGVYQTQVDTVKQLVAVDEKGVEEYQDKEVPVVKIVNGVAQFGANPLEVVGISKADIDITGFDFEDKTLTQISERRDATNRAMTAKDRAKAAYWEKQQKEAEGEKNVAIKMYAEKEKAQIDIQAAEKAKQLAIINAKRETEKAIELTKAAKEEEKRQRALAKAAIEQSKAIKTLADAEAYKLQEVQKGGELKLRLDNELAKAKVYANAMANMKSPETLVINGSAMGEGSEADMKTLVQFKAIEQVKSLANAKKQ